MMLLILGCVLIHGVASIRVDFLSEKSRDKPREKPRVAILIVGRSSNSRRMADVANMSKVPLQNGGVGPETGSTTNIVDFMTGEEDDDAGTYHSAEVSDGAGSIW